MAGTTQYTTDSQIEKRLRNSHISLDQQRDLGPLIPAMTEAERLELLKLIERSNRELGHKRHAKRHSHRLLVMGIVGLAILAGLATLGLSLMD